MRRRRTFWELASFVLVAVVTAVAVLILGARFGVLLPQARFLIEAGANGLKVGRLGRLQIEGLGGDIWRDMTVRKVTIRDEGGVWIEADNVHMSWRYGDLLKRKFYASAISADVVKVLRRPTLTAKGKDTGLPVAFHIGDAKARVEFAPQFSYERGVYDLDLNLDVARNGDQRGQVRAASVLHPGDYLYVDYDVAKARPLEFLVDAEEARGGALAGALGLPSNQAFTLKVAAGGSVAAGRFGAVAGSGNLEPLRAQGEWSSEGGVVAGHIALSASSLAAPYARRIGSQASFVLAGRRAGADLFAIDGRVVAENLAFRARGLADVGARKVGPQGLDVTAETASLSKIVEGPELGRTRIAGRLTQAGAQWRFAGTGAVQAASFGGYGLAQASGPVEVAEKAGQWDVKTSLVGAGGRGAGFVAAVLGATPKASFDGSRLADGRLLMRDLKITGAGLNLETNGARGLLGGLTFKGKASVSNLAAARPGAAGAAEFNWSAAQAKADQPWTFSLEARGDKFASGLPELDRLLGAKPQLKAEASLKDRRLAVGSAQLTGAAVRASTAGILAPDGGLTFKLDWNADGPFHAGPVEITGKAKGSGAITGTLSQPRADLLADLAEIDIPRLPLKDAHLTLSFLSKPDGSSGMVALTATSTFGPARGRADFRFPQGGVDLTALSVDAGGVKASGSLSLKSRSPSAANLEVAVTRGALLDAGRVAGTVRIADAAGGPQTSLNLGVENVRLPGSNVTVRGARLSADGPLARLPYAIRGDGVSEGGLAGGKWSLDGKGVFSEGKPGYAASFEGMGKLGGRDLHTLEPALVRFGGPEQSARLRLAASDGGRIDLDGRLSDAGTDIRTQVTGLGLGLVDEDLAGRTDATLVVQGRGARLDGTLEAKLSGARARGSAAASGIDGRLSGKLSGDSLSLTLAATNAQGLNANGTLVLPAEASAAPFRIAIARERPMRGQFLAEGEARPLFDLLIGGERSLAGKVHTEGVIGGSLAHPGATGTISVAGGRFDDGSTGLSLREVALKADFTQDGVNVTESSGVDGRGGSVTGAGRISLVREGASSFRLALKSFRLIDNDIATASASGQATIDRAADGKVRLTGALTIDRADVAARLPTPSGVVTMQVVEKNRPPDLAAAPLPPDLQGDGWALDVSLKAPAHVYLKGRGLDTELALDARVRGTTAHPDLSGTAHVVRGGYDFAGKRFEFDPQSVVYLSTDAAAVRLDLTAIRDDPTLTAQVHIRGTAQRPEITLTSTPSLPNDEVLSQVLFGRTASQLSPLEAAQLASAISGLAGGGGLDVVGNLRAFARLDRLALGGGDASGVTVSGGKYLTDNVYLEVTGGGREGPSAQVEWRVRRTLSIISRIGGLDTGHVAVRWRRDY